MALSDAQVIPELMDLQSIERPDFVPPQCDVCEQPVVGSAFIDDGVYHSECYRKFFIGGHAFGIDGPA